MDAIICFQASQVERLHNTRHCRCVGDHHRHQFHRHPSPNANTCSSEGVHSLHRQCLRSFIIDQIRLGCLDLNQHS